MAAEESERLVGITLDDAVVISSALEFYLRDYHGSDLENPALELKNTIDSLLSNVGGWRITASIKDVVFENGIWCPTIRGVKKACDSSTIRIFVKNAEDVFGIFNFDEISELTMLQMKTLQSYTFTK